MGLPRCAVLLHVFYPDLWGEIASYLHRLDGVPFDLFINAVHGQTDEAWRREVCREFPGAKVFESPNLGQDVGGTAALLEHVDLGGYDLVCKLHTKKCTYNPAGGAQWRRELFDACLHDPRHVFDVFARDPRVTMLASAERLMIGNGMNQRNCERLCDRLKLDRQFVNSPWVAGTMFWCRPYIMQALKDAKLRQDEFIFAYGHDGTLAHALERVFGALAASRGEIHWSASSAGIGKAPPLPSRPRRAAAREGRVKWFFCLNDHEPRFADCAKVAVLSSAPFPLDRFCIYDGSDERFVSWMSAHGVRVIRHRFSLSAELMQARPDAGVGLGAFLRIDLPEIMEDQGLGGTRSYLYTDCDVMFQNDPSELLDVSSETFAAAIELHDREAHFNSGVMWCNADFFRGSLGAFRRHLIEKRFEFVAFDQGALNEFYGASRQKLGREYNWKPHWGIDENAVIVHFHGPKPWEFRLWERDPEEFARSKPILEPFLRPHTREAYRHFAAKFEGYLDQA